MDFMWRSMFRSYSCQSGRLLSVPQRCRDGRAHPLWLQGRRNRLTASRFAGACGQGRRSMKETLKDWALRPFGHVFERFGLGF